METQLPCGCVVISEKRPLTINDVDMSDLVSTITDIRRCPEHQASWDAGIKLFSDAIDAKILAMVINGTS